MSTTETQGSFTPFRQTPIWADDEQFTLTGKQLKAVQQMAESYTKFIAVMEGFFSENLDNGKINIVYEDMQGNPLTKEQIQVMLQEHARILAESLNEQ